MSKWRPVPLNCLYVIPDIHGGLSLLELICDRILPLRKSDGGKDRIIFLGDYIDRHVDSHKVLDFLIKLEKDCPDQVTFIMGNHELMLLEAFNLRPGVEVALQRQEAMYQMWLHNGGLNTLIGYLERANLAEENPLTIPKHRVISLIPKEHIEFLQRLSKYYELDDYVFVHGGMQPNSPPSNQNLEFLTWDRSLLKFVIESLKEKNEIDWAGLNWEKIIVTGHNVLANKLPIVTEKFMMLDCGSPRQLLVTELRSMEAYMAHPDNNRLVKFELKEPMFVKPLFRRVDKPDS